MTYYPYTFRDADHLLAYTKSDIFKELTKGYEDKSGHHIVAVTYYGVRHTSSNKPIKTCADMKGLKMRVPDVPAYLAMPRACGANTAPIAFAEVYLALQNGTVEAQENPLTTIEAKKFYEVQKHIVLTGHIVDHLNTVVAGALWKKLSDEDKKIFTDVAQEAAAKATAEIKQNEAKLVDFFKEKGLTVTEVDKNEFRDTVLKNVAFETFGYRKADWERIQAVNKRRAVIPRAVRTARTTVRNCAPEIIEVPGPALRPARNDVTSLTENTHVHRRNAPGRSRADEIAHTFEEEATPRSTSASTLSRTGWRWRSSGSWRSASSSSSSPATSSTTAMPGPRRSRPTA